MFWGLVGFSQGIPHHRRHFGVDFAGEQAFLLHITKLGVGGNTPGIIKVPFLRMTAQNSRSTYACINLGEAYAPKEIEDRAVCINGDIGQVISKMRLM